MTVTKRILVVDDEEHIQEVIQTCLEILQNWQVILAGSGMEGLRQAEMQQPDAILLDISMPDMDGLTTLQRLRENPITQTIPVILLTAKVQPSDHARFATLDITGIITKPFDPMTLAEQIAETLNWEL